MAHMSQKQPQLDKKELDKKEIEARKEVHISISLKGVVDGYMKVCYDIPRDLFDWTTRKLDDVSKKMRTGYLAVIGLPASIVIRNGARVAHNASAERGKRFASSLTSNIVGVVGAGAAWWTTGSMLFGKLMTSLAVASTVGKVGATVGAAVMTGMTVVVPAFTAGMLISAATLGVAASALSLVLATAPNVKPGWQRTKDRFKGIKYNEDDLDKEYDQESLSSDYYASKLREVGYGLSAMRPQDRKEIYISLRQEFEKATANDDLQAAPGASAKNTPPRQTP